ncbi:hypothetical protein F4818DRAFT_292568 [Hypoxylon cercidicola]|nr:hypothetical protein F4818DRAFT_292568 [Hypoxylon cercidicola]
MSQLPVRGSKSGEDPEAKRRKIRKGTHSCWECRRRKTRCKYASDAAAVCVGCEQRGTTCRSQEFPDAQPPASERGLSQRLSRVEGMLERLVERIAPDTYTPHRVCERPLTSSASAEELDSPSDILRPSAAEHPPVIDILDALREDCGSAHASFIPTPASTEADVPYALPARHAQVSRVLHATFPCQHDIDSILAVNWGAYFVATFFSPDGPPDPTSCISEVPPVTSHPVLLARRLMQLANCMQKMPPETIPKDLVSKEPFRVQMSRFVSVVSDLVVSNDDLVGSVEGLETLYLIVLYHGNAGNLRKSWLALRRTIAVAQLMGVDRWPDSKPLKSVDPRSDPAARTRAGLLWYRFNFSDRYLSLLLGLPAACDDDSFAEPGRMAGSAPAERLEKLHAVIMGAIIRRNASTNRHQHRQQQTAAVDAAFGTTQTIDCDLELAAKSMGAEWWQPVAVPDPATASPMELVQAHGHVMMQMNHHHLLILLHLPYMLRDPKERRWDYSKTTCLHASRELLRAYLLFRHLTDAASACRHTDYGALTAAMTLLLGYLDPKLRARDPEATRVRAADRDLAAAVRDVVADIAARAADKLAAETSDIITRLLPLTDVDLPAAGHGLEAPVRLEIPYLGNVTINPVSRRAQPEQHQYDSSAAPVPTARYDEGGEKPMAELDHLRDSTPSNNHLYMEPPSVGNTLVDPCLQHPEVPSGCMVAFGEDANFSFMQFEPDISSPYQFPDLAADMDQWTFQGFDATFFESLFS